MPTVSFLVNPIRRRYFLLALTDGGVMGFLALIFITHIAKVFYVRLFFLSTAMAIGPPLLYVSDFYNFDKPIPNLEKNLFFWSFSGALSAVMFFRHGSSWAQGWALGLYLSGLASYTMLIRPRLTFGIFSRRLSVFFLGADDSVRELVAEMNRYVLPIFDVMMIVCAEKDCSCAADWDNKKYPIVHDLEQPAAALNSRHFDLVLFSTKSEMPSKFRRILLRKKFKGSYVVDVPTYFKTLTNRVRVQWVSEDWFLYTQHFSRGSSWIRSRIKRGLDFIVAALLILITAPLWAILAALIYLVDGRPVLFRQSRVGQFWKPFTVYKFRTLADGEEGKFPVTVQGDPRITRLGKVLRQLHLDELPQLWNIVKGDMDFVGPRPLNLRLEEKLADMSPFYDLRYLVPPGLTGWAQVQNLDSRSAEGQRQRLEYDLFYVLHQSFLLEVFIILKTFRAIVHGWGAR